MTATNVERKPAGPRPEILTPPGTAGEFLALARRYEAVPVVRTLLADLTTPLGAFLRLRNRSASAFLLESIQGGENVSRYSFLGSRPYARLAARGGEVREWTADGERILASGSVPPGAGPAPAIPFLAAARERLRPLRQPRFAGLPPFIGGAVGWVGYGCARWFEPVLGAETRATEEPEDALLLFFRTVTAFDHARQRLHVGSLIATGDAASESELLERWEAARAEVREIESVLLESDDGFRGAVRAEVQAAGETRRAEARSVPDRAAFETAVRRAQDHIRAGDAFQIVLSRRLETELAADPLEVYRALRTVDPAPYMFFVQSGETCVLGASPETLVKVEGRDLRYRPIAGTRRRGSDEDEDLALEEELRADPKEVAEHVMLVDLGRNDLGRVAETGSVRVDRLMAVERYSHVMHLVSTLSARLRPELDRFDALAACFPAGTVSGAPKVRAMQIIDELEPVPRGVYAGAVLYLDFAGNLDSCIAIRTLMARGRRAVLQAGAGIVADSVPEREFEETAAKAGALLRAIELAESWSRSSAEAAP
ncbi:MAG TPA: anthranilate synthase component I family protein [Gemmatimonadota bacterium]|jgi:anthranilate synthase component 1